MEYEEIRRFETGKIIELYKTADYEDENDHSAKNLKLLEKERIRQQLRSLDGGFEE